MSDDAHESLAADAAHPEVKRSRFNIIWLIPAVAILLGGGLLFKSFMNRGTEITIAFQTADGLEEGKTNIRFRDVNVGIVDTIDVADNRTHVVVNATMHASSKHLLSDKTRFWVVRPRASLRGISGLGTLLSGAYIAVDPEDGKPQLSFTGMEEPPMIGVDEVGRRFTLHADELGSVSEGAPIYYRGLPVGEVLRYQLDDDGQGVTIEIFVHDPHPVRVTERARFWNASGIEATLDTSGIKIRTESLEALALGGVAFENTSEGAPAAKEGTTFRLHPERAAEDRHYTEIVPYICYFEDSIGGLTVGAPVEYHGFQVGVVASIAVENDPNSDLIRLPVTIHVQPERFQSARDPGAVAAGEMAKKLMSQGLRAQLKTGNLLTGQKLVDMVIEPDIPVRLVGGPNPVHPEIATIPGTFEGIEKSIARAVRTLDKIMVKIDEMPLQELVQNAADAAGAIEKLAESEELNGAIAAAHKVLEDIDPVIQDLHVVLRDSDAAIKSIVSETEKTASKLREVLDHAETTLDGVNSFVSPDSPIGTELASALKDFGAASRSLRQLADYLDRHPEALLSGKSGSGGR